MRSFQRIFIAAVCLPGVCFDADAGDYLRDVKPLLKAKCYACHGALRQQGGLRLDTGKALISGGDSGVAIEAGKPDSSLLIGVLSGDAGFRMPPASDGTPLTDAEQQLIREWIENGAAVPDEEEPQTDPHSWWSYRPIVSPLLPELAAADWCRSDVDHFIAAERQRHGLPHVIEASKSEWLRRVFLDLIGLPPTRQELHRFMADESGAAYETVVDDLLSRPQYGERWGRHWMDVWRYSDWYGSRRINEIRYSQRHIWRWRDWIVRSVNEDKGYDQMVREMLAADEIDGGSSDNLAATGYLARNWYKFDRNVWMFETVERTGEAFLGMTFRCCRCHDHKFDPVTQEEYYRFRAFFEPHDVRTDPISALTGTQKDATLGHVLNDGIALVYDKDPDAKTYRFERGDARYPDKSKELAPGIPAALGGSIDVAAVRLPVATWYPIMRPDVRRTVLEKGQADIAVAEKAVASQRQKLQKIRDRLSQLDDTAPDSAAVDFLVDDFSRRRSDVWDVVNGDWNYADGKLVQSAVTSFATMVTKKNHPADFQVQLRYRPLQPGTYRSIGFSFDYQDKGNSQDVYTSTGDSRQSVQAFHRTGGKQVYPQAGIVSTKLAVEEEATIDVWVAGKSLTIDLNGERKLKYTIPLERRDGRFALWVHQGAAEFLELKLIALAESRETLESQLKSEMQTLRVAEAQLKVAQAELHSVERRLAAEAAIHSKGLSPDSAAVADAARDAAIAERQVAVLEAELKVIKAADSPENLKKANEELAVARQEAAKPAEKYSPLGEQYPQTSTGRRTALAKWITDPQNPRTARVAVNHIWSRHFGRPLAETPENFGLNGRPPSHPKLLDRMASELIACGWKMKTLHRQLVLSATYRMATAARFPGDAIATAAMKAAAVQSDPQNQFFWRMNSRRMEAEVVRDSTLYIAERLDLAQGGPEISESDGEKILRRSLYFRNTPNEKMPMLEVFDVANPNGCYQRKASVVPNQSLAMMNSGLAQDSARLIAESLAAESDFVTAAFETVLNRPPGQEESARCQAFLKEHAELLNETSDKFSAGGSAKRKPATDRKQRARENLIHVLFLHNDFVTIR